MCSLQEPHKIRPHGILVCLIFLVSNGIAQKPSPNVARRGEHPYVEPAGNRDQHPLAGETVNEARVYDFYQRQADYYMSGATIPDILPAFPGLDAGEHGHWGKHNQNNHEDGRWNEIDFGPLVTQVFRTEKDFVILKGMSVSLAKNHALSACFDPMALSYRCVWQDGFIRFHPFRWGTSRNAAPDGRIWFKDSDQKGWSGTEEASAYIGNYRDADDVIFHYRIGETEILDRPGVLETPAGAVFQRTLSFRSGAPDLRLRGGVIPADTTASWLGLVSTTSGKTTEIRPDDDGVLWIDAPDTPGQLTFSLWSGDSKNLTTARAALVKAPRPEPLRPTDQARPQWPDAITMKGTPGTPTDADAAYVVDTFDVPYKNPWNVVMQLSGIGFLKDGTALVSTLSGDVWKVSGMDDSLQEVKWKRYATGFNQPLGIHIDEDGVFVLDRGQITRLHDLNGDDEADFYENYANDFGGYDRSHSHTFGLARTADGAFTFVQREEILRTSPERKTSRLAWGVRNCMGVGGSDDLVFVAPQEGTWTPASMIIEVQQGEFYGLPVAGDNNPNIATPLCYIPRGVDNSTGGIVEVTSDRWGPLQGGFVGISYGSGTYYSILRDASGPRAQGAVVPLEGEFLSGTMRGAFRPQDGQLYVVGLDGWGDYAARDGCLHRIRYTGKPLRKPTGFQVFENGIRIDFPLELDAATAQSADHYFVHQWNYEYARRYGSPEFSQRHPESLGHDRLDVRSATLLNQGRSIFLEIPELEPVMQMHVRMHLQDAGGTDFKTDLFPSILHLGERLEHPGFAPSVPGKPTAIALRIRRDKEDTTPADSTSGQVVEGARTISINAIGGLQFEQKAFTVKAGEAIALQLKNKDVMPHNLVIVKPGTEKAVGNASFAMLNDPDAGAKHYIPDTTDVIAHTFVISPNTTHTLHFKAPAKPGNYPYMCTFPGHWMAMRGIMTVE